MVDFQLPDDYTSQQGRLKLKAVLAMAIVVQFAGANKEIAARLEDDLENQLEDVASINALTWVVLESCAKSRTKLAEKTANLTEVFDKMMKLSSPSMIRQSAHCQGS